MQVHLICRPVCIARRAKGIVTDIRGEYFPFLEDVKYFFEISLPVILLQVH